MDLGNLKVVITAETAALSAGLATASALVARFAATSGAGYASAATGARAAATAMNNLNMAGAGLARTTASVATLGVAFRTLATNAVGLLKIAGPIAAIGVALAMTIGPAKAFETAFTGVLKTVEGTPAELDKVRRGILDMSREIPAAAGEIAAVAEVAGQLGIAVPDLLDFTRVMIDLGESTTLSATNAATALARFGNIMANSQNQGDPLYWERLGSTIVELGNNFATTETEIATFANRIGGAGAVVGLAEAEILAIGTALSSVGIFAEAGGTAVSRVLIEIDTAARSLADGGSPKLEAFANIAGRLPEEFARIQESNPAEAFTLVVEGLQRIEEEGGSAALSLESVGLQNVRVRDAMLRLAAAGDLLRVAISTGNAEWQANSALTEESTRRYETAAARVDVLKNSFNVLAIDMGTVLLPSFVAVVDAMIEGVQYLSTELSPAFNAVADGVVDLADAFGPLTDAFGDIAGLALVATIEGIAIALEALGQALGATADAASGLFDAVGFMAEFLTSLGGVAATALTLAGLALVFTEVGIGAGVAAGGASILAGTLSGLGAMASGAATSLLAINPAVLAIAASGAVFLGVTAEIRNARDAADEFAESITAAFKEAPDISTANAVIADLRAELLATEAAWDAQGNQISRMVEVAIGVLPFVGSEVITLQERYAALAAELKTTGEQAQNFSTNVNTVANIMGLSEVAVSSMITALGLQEQAMNGIAIQDFILHLRAFTEENEGAVVSLTRAQSAWEKYSQAISESRATYQIAADAIGLTTDQLFDLADVMDVEIGGLLDPDKWAELSLEMTNQIYTWEQMGESVGLTADKFLEVEKSMLDVNTTVSTLEGTMDGVREVFEATTMQADGLSEATEAFGQVAVAFAEGEASAREYLESMRDLTLAYAASGVSAQEAVDKQLSLLSAWLDGAEAANMTKEAAAELAIQYGLIPETILTEVAWEGQEALQATEQYQLALEQVVAKVWIAEVMAEDGGTFEEVAENLGLLELFSEGDWTAILNADATQAINEALAVSVALEAFESGDYTAILSVEDESLRAGIANALLGFGKITEEEHRAILGLDDSLFAANMQAALDQLGQVEGDPFTAVIDAINQSSGVVDAVLEGLLSIEDDWVADIVVNAAGAVVAVGAVAGALAGLKDRNVVVTVNGRAPGGTIGLDNYTPPPVNTYTPPTNFTGRSANGNLFEFYAHGGIRRSRESHVATIAPSGMTRVWNEPETGGEAYIPLAPTKRARSKAIWHETGRRLGMADGGVLNFAEGGITSNSFSTASGIPGVIVNVAVDARSIGQVAIDLAPVNQTIRETAAVLDDAADAADDLATRGGRVLVEAFGDVSSAIETTHASTRDMVTVFDQAGLEMTATIHEIGQTILSEMETGEFVRTMAEDFGWAGDQLDAYMKEMDFSVAEAVESMMSSSHDLAYVWEGVWFDAASSSEVFEVAMRNASDAMREVDDSARLARDGIELLSGTLVDGINAQFDYLDAVDRVKEAIGNGEAFSAATTETRRNYEELIRAGQAMADYGIEIAGTAQTTAGAIDQWRALEEEFRVLAAAAGLSTTEVDVLATALFAVPDSTIAEIQVEGLEAQQELDVLTEALGILDGYTSTPELALDDSDFLDVYGAAEAAIGAFDEAQAQADLGADATDFDEKKNAAIAALELLEGWLVVAIMNADDENIRMAYEEALENLQEIDLTEAEAKVDADTAPFTDATVVVATTIVQIDESRAEPEIDADSVPFNSEASAVTDTLNTINVITSTPKFDADPSQFEQRRAALESALGKIDATTATATLDGDPGPFNAVAAGATAAANAFANAPYNATLTGTDAATAVANGAAASANGFANARYNATLSATDSASAVSNAAASVARAFATTYTARLAANDAASGVIRGAKAAANGFAGTYRATLETTKRTIYETVTTGASAGASAGTSGGGYKPPNARAAGGFDVANGHRPEFASASSQPWRLWKEPETAGESYIPHANDWRRAGALRVLEQTAALMGRRVVDNAAGGFLGRAVASGQGGAVAVVVQPGAVQLNVDVNQVDDQRIIDASRRAGEALVKSMTSQLEGVR